MCMLSLPGFMSAVLTAHRLNGILQRTPEPAGPLSLS